MKSCSFLFNKIKKAIAMNIVEGKPEPAPNGAVKTIRVICSEKIPCIKWLYAGSAFSLA